MLQLNAERFENQALRNITVLFLVLSLKKKERKRFQCKDYGDLIQSAQQFATDRLEDI